MKQKIIKHLNFYYYGMMLLAVLVATLAYFLIVKEYVQVIEPASSLGQIIQYVVIFDALITIPLGLYWCKRRCVKLSLLTDEEAKLLGYKKAATLRILLVCNAMVFAMAAFYLMGAYQSMLWIAAISAIGWYFTKPTLQKMELELQPTDPNAEQY